MILERNLEETEKPLQEKEKTEVLVETKSKTSDTTPVTENKGEGRPQRDLEGPLALDFDDVVV